MVIPTIGDVLPIALAIGTSPIPLVAVVLVLGSRRAVANGIAFAIGWIVGLLAVTGVLTMIVDVADDAEGSDTPISIVGGVITVVLGLLFWFLAVRAWRGRPTAGATAELPEWMSSLDTVEPGRALVIGLGLAGVNPKNLALVLAGVTTIVTAGLNRTGVIVALAAFVLVGSVGVLGLVGYRTVRGTRADAALGRIQAFLVAHHHVIVLVVLALLGAKFVGDGVGALLTK